jgi:TP901 family phage tail tape measure protein
MTQVEAPTRRASALFSNLFESIKSTARWQISSSILQGFTSSIREAFSYAQNLNKAMNDIKIVSDMSTSDLERFARVANANAKKLSTTTKEYANASLIFFQQGLSEEEVTRRTDAVIKMSHVTGDAVSDVSSYMTAIWNNFADGEVQLERYADIITALGAATASSSEEIAGGLEKFAAIAETVGLSYEYATTALATVVSKTRQSEETVGTSFKTIFGRLESLNLGETLDDGTTLTKYSNALQTVGVSIMDANGELKDMDTILNELGKKWSDLSKDEQVALANTVAGTRQYNNFIALMESFGGEF